MSAFLVSKRHIDVLVAAAMGEFHISAHPGDTGPYVSWYDIDVETEECPYSLESDEFTQRMAWYSDHHVVANTATAAQVGRMLWWECMRSVAYCYDDDELSDLPGYGASADDIDEYRYTWPGRRFEAVEVLKAIECYEYQSCEHPDWKKSEAARFCEALSHAMIDELPGYDDAAWAIEPETVEAHD